MDGATEQDLFKLLSSCPRFSAQWIGSICQYLCCARGEVPTAISHINLYGVEVSTENLFGASFHSSKRMYCRFVSFNIYPSILVTDPWSTNAEPELKPPAILSNSTSPSYVALFQSDWSNVPFSPHVSKCRRPRILHVWRKQTHIAFGLLKKCLSEFQVWCFSSTSTCDFQTGIDISW